MGGGMQPRGGIIQGINVTPLVDIALVLLIIFIVTAKMVVTPAVPLDLPQASQSEEIQTVFALSVQPDGALVLDGAPLPDAALAEKAEAARARDEGLRAVIQADGAVPHRRVMEVLDTLKAAGLERVAFGTVKPEGSAAAQAGAPAPQSADDPQGEPDHGSP
jgi:biopolymer transport protein ExbD